MTWTDEQWDVFAVVLQRAFAARDQLDAADLRVYRLLLDEYDPDAAMTALRSLIAAGQALRPRPGEIIQAIRTDPSAPTFDEAMVLLFGARGALLAQAPAGRYDSERDRSVARHAAIAERLQDLHPLIRAFVARQDIDRLLRLPLNDPQWGEKHRADLQRSWEAHVTAFDGRDVALLAAGPRGRGELARLDPLAALGLDPPAGLLEERSS